MPDYYDAFASALRSGDASPIAEMSADPRVARRFAIYRNNVVRGAIEALRAAYPAINRLVGDRYFSTLAKAYWEHSPPVEPSLSLYGGGFPDHVEQANSLAHRPWLGDVARLDRAWLCAHHGAETGLLDPAELAQWAPDALPTLKLDLIPAHHVVRSDWQIAPVWLANREEGAATPPSIEPGPQTILIWRRAGAVQHHVLDPGRSAFLAAIASGATLGEASVAALSHNPDADPGLHFGWGLEAGLFQTFQDKGPRP